MLVQPNRSNDERNAMNYCVRTSWSVNSFNASCCTSIVDALADTVDNACRRNGCSSFDLSFCSPSSAPIPCKSGYSWQFSMQTDNKSKMPNRRVSPAEKTAQAASTYQERDTTGGRPHVRTDAMQPSLAPSSCNDSRFKPKQR